MLGQNVINIPLVQAQDSAEKRAELIQILFKHAGAVVDIVAEMPPAEQHAVLDIAKNIIIANNARLQEQTMQSMQGQAQNIMGNLFGGTAGADGTLKPQSKGGVSWLGDALKDEEDAK